MTQNHMLQPGFYVLLFICLIISTAFAPPPPEGSVRFRNPGTSSSSSGKHTDISNYLSTTSKKFNRHLENARNRFEEWAENTAYTLSDDNILKNINKRFPEVVRAAAKTGITGRLGGNGLLIYAAERGETNVVRELLKDRSIDPSTQNDLALKLAVKNGHYNTALVLIHDKLSRYWRKAVEWFNKMVNK